MRRAAGTAVPGSLAFARADAAQPGVVFRTAPFMLATALAWLAGCTTPPAETPPARSVAAPATPAQRARADYERTLVERAQTASAQRRWADAALAWELFGALHPDDPAAAERLAEARQRVRAASAEQAARATQASQRGDLDAATQRWLAVLALDPSDAAAATALRKLEAERNRKTYLGHHAGSTLTRKSVAEAEAMPAATASIERPDLERAAAMAADGEYDGAINLLEDRIANDRRDVAARRLLADVYRREGDTLAKSNPARSRTLFARSARVGAADRTPAVVRAKSARNVDQTAAAPAPAPASAPSVKTASDRSALTPRP